MNRDASLPDFIGIGAQKAGTTWLSHNLQLHPEIWMPKNKELHYFNYRINDPKNPVSRFYGKMVSKGNVDGRWRQQAKIRLGHHLRHLGGEDFLWDLKYYAGAPNDAWYASLFEPGRGRVKGEITPGYSTLGRETIARVHDLVPEAKLIFMMRNPIERAWSQFTMRLDKSGKKNLTLPRHKKLLRNVEKEGSRSRTDYLQTLENWTGFYPEERIFVGFLEDVRFHPEKFLGDVYAFLDVDASFRPRGVGERVHARSAGRIPAQSAVYLTHLYREGLSRLDEHFGGYASFWSYCAEKLIEMTPEEEYLPYPLWESAFWEEWIKEGTGRPGYQSGPLPSVKNTTR